MDSLFPEVLSLILNFLDKDSIINFSCVIKDRHLIKESLKKTRLPMLLKCKWSYLNEMKSVNETVLYKNLNRISDICKNLIIYSNYNYRYKHQNLYIENNNIEKLHIDLSCHNIYVNIIKSLSLKELIIVHCKINKDFLENINENCPNIKKIKIFYSSIDNYEINSLII
jgi:hypothetical protein